MCCCSLFVRFGKWRDRCRRHKVVHFGRLSHKSHSDWDHCWCWCRFHCSWWVSLLDIHMSLLCIAFHRRKYSHKCHNGWDWFVDRCRDRRIAVVHRGKRPGKDHQSTLHCLRRPVDRHRSVVGLSSYRRSFLRNLWCLLYIDSSHFGMSFCLCKHFHRFRSDWYWFVYRRMCQHMGFVAMDRRRRSFQRHRTRLVGRPWGHLWCCILHSGCDWFGCPHKRHCSLFVQMDRHKSRLCMFCHRYTWCCMCRSGCCQLLCRYTSPHIGFGWLDR